MDLGQLQAQEGEFCDPWHSSCICRLSPASILRETSTKASRNANSSLTGFPHCLLLLTLLPLDCYLTPTGLFCSPFSTASLRLPSSTDPVSSLVPSSPRPRPVSWEISSSSPLFGFRAKTKRSSDRPTHTHPTQWPHRVTQEERSRVRYTTFYIARKRHHSRMA